MEAQFKEADRSKERSKEECGKKKVGKQCMMTLGDLGLMSTHDGLSVIFQIWRGAEAPCGWYGAEKKPVYILCD